MFVRGSAALLCGLALLNLIARCLGSGRDCTLWWIDLRPLPPWMAMAVEFLAAGAFGVLAWGTLHPPWIRRSAAAVFAMLGVVAAGNAVQFFRVTSGGDVAPLVLVPLSAVVALALGCVAWRAWRSRPLDHAHRRSRWPRLAFVAGFLTAAAVLPLAQMFFFGSTDYRRPADAVVVFGAGVDAEGRPSLALSDRVETACRLYHEGRAPLLIFSGGPGPTSGVHETDAMRDLALRRGVPAQAILLDRDGLTTDATVRSTVALLDARGLKRVLAVSHSYHLPRVKLAYRRAGREVYTVPAEQSRGLVRMPYYVAREVAALWMYYLRGILTG